MSNFPDFSDGKTVMGTIHAKLDREINFFYIFNLFPLTEVPDGTELTKIRLPKGSIFSLKIRDKKGITQRRGITVNDTECFPHNTTCYISIGEKNPCAKISKSTIHCTGIKDETDIYETVGQLLKHINRLIHITKRMKKYPEYTGKIIDWIESQYKNRICHPHFEAESPYDNEIIYKYFRTLTVDFNKHPSYVRKLRKIHSKFAVGDCYISDDYVDVDTYYSNLCKINIYFKGTLNLNTVYEQINGKKQLYNNFCPNVKKTSFKVEIPYKPLEGTKTKKKKKCTTINITSSGCISISSPSLILAKESYNYLSSHLSGDLFV